MLTPETPNDVVTQSDVVAQKDATVVWLEEMKAEDVVVVPVASISTVADYFIIACGRSQVHLHSIAMHVQAAWSQAYRGRVWIEGRGSEWVLLDMNAVVTHLMSREARAFYDLEGLWSPELWK